MLDSVTVRVPASSANLGPGFDVLAAALDLHLRLEVSRAGQGAPVVDVGDLDLPADDSNLCVRAFAALLPVEGLRFALRSEIPVGSGLGSSGAAIVAGLIAAERMGELDVPAPELLARARTLEGHPDNVAASLYGGFVICAVGGRGESESTTTARIEVPRGLHGVLVIPPEPLPTTAARAALPDQVPLAEASFNVAHAALLVRGLSTGEPELISAGLKDRLHQPRRAPLYARSIEIVRQARSLGALGATISGAGPSVLVWTTAERSADVAAALAKEVDGWAEVRRAGFAGAGATVIDQR